MFLVDEKIAIAQTDKTKNKENIWKASSEDILKILYTPKLLKTYIFPNKKYMILTNPIVCFTISELSQPMLKPIGIRVNPKNNYYHGKHDGTSKIVLTIKSGKTIPLNIPKKEEVHSIYWTPEGKHFALSIGFKNRMELWLIGVDGDIERIHNITLNLLIENLLKWFPNKENILIRKITNRKPASQKTLIQDGSKILEDNSPMAKSTHKSRNLLTSAFNDKQFNHCNQYGLVKYNIKSKTRRTIGLIKILKTIKLTM